MECPDPSAHDHSNTLSSAASTAALYATHPEKNPNNPLGNDGKLSSKSAATSLKYAQAKDLPSFPSRGAEFSAANQAAMMAKDHKMKELWQPETSVAGSKAALLAHKDGGKLDLWEHTPSADSNSAATLAMRTKGLSPQTDRGYTDAGRNSSLLAATKSHNMGRQRAGSSPAVALPSYPDQQNSMKNALSAATVSHRASVRNSDGWDSQANQAARIKNAHLDRELFTEDPHLQTQQDIDDQNHQAALHASAASFAKSIYAYQKRGEVDAERSSLHDDDGTTGAATAHRRNVSAISQPNVREEAIRYLHLQDAAHKLAQERLAKVDKDMEAGRYREYYGYPNKSPRKSRLSMRSGRKRASSEGRYDSDDEMQARRIRSQMSQLSTGVAGVSDKQKQEDRARLLAAAEKRVHAQMHDMDEKVFMDTGKPTQSMKDEWEVKAREKAERDMVDRERNPGKTHIGGGKYMSNADIEAIAAARLKPTLDELNDTAEKKRARDEEYRAERDRLETARMQEKMDENAKKAEFKRIKEQDKAAAKREKEERKAAERAEKEQAKARKSEDKRKSREQKRDDVTAVTGGAALAEVAEKVKTDDQPETTDAAAVTPAVVTSQDRGVATSEQDTEKEKSGRGMFDRIASKLKKHNEGRKSGEAERTTQPVTEEEPSHDDGAVIGGVAALGIGAAAATGLAEEHVSERDVAGNEIKQEESTFAPVTAAMPAAGDVHEESHVPVQEEGSAVPAAVAMPAAGDVHEESHVPVQDESTTVPVAAAMPAAGDVHEESHVPVTTSEDRGVVETDVTPVPGTTVIDTGATAPGDLERKDDEQRDIATPIPNATAISTSTSVPAEEDQAVSPVEETTADEDQSESKTGKRVAATVGIAALGGIVAAGAMGAAHRRKQESAGQEEVEVRDNVSDLSTEDEEDLKRPELRQVASAEHTGSYIFAAPATGSARRPDLERHISTIPDSESDADADDESDELDSSDDEDLYSRPTQSRVQEGVAPVHTEHSEEQPQGDRAYVIDPTPKPQEDDGVPSWEGPPPAPRPAPLDLPRDEHGNILVVNKAAPGEAPKLAVAGLPNETAPAESEPAQSAFTTAERSAPAPVVKTNQKQSNSTEKEKEKDSKGVRGFFSKLRGKSKAENKLHKEPPASESSEKPTITTAIPSGDMKSDDVITPVTTTSAGRAIEGHDSVTAPAEHIGTDGPIGDPHHISGIGGDPRPASPSSFRRHDRDNTDRDLDDVSSSGADEEDYVRGRVGKLRKKLGLAKGKDVEKPDEAELEQSTSNGDEQFEEARDHFDESLAPPPAFAGQAKSESPNRTTKFQEQL